MLAVKKSILIFAALAATVLLIAGCGGSGASNGTKASADTHAKAVRTSVAKSNKTGQKTADTKPTSVPGEGVQIPAKIPNDVSLRKFVAVSSCTLSKRIVKAAGTASNRGHSATGYKLTLFVTNARSTVTGTGTATVHVAAQGSSKWSIKSSVVNLAGKPHCVLVGVGKA
jgi:hypothetical protein